MYLPEIQAVFFDFDHTLYSHRTKTIPQSAKDSIKILQKKGIDVPGDVLSVEEMVEALCRSN